MYKQLDYMKDTIVITNRALVEGDYLETIRVLASRKPHAIILREKDLSKVEYKALAKDVLSICRQESVPCYIHTYAELANELMCENLHVSVYALMAGGLDVQAKSIERLSVSCHSMEDVKIALAYGATQIVLGTIFETDCKKGLKGKGTEFVNEVSVYCRQHGNVPVYAIGGINPDMLQLVKQAGAAGGCMMSYAIKACYE